MGKSNVLASGVVTLSTDADQLVQGLDRAQAKVNASAKSLGDAFKRNEVQSARLGQGLEQVGKKAKAAGGDGATSIGKFLTGLKQANVVELGVAGTLGLIAAGTAKAFITEPLQAWRKELEKGLELSRQILDMTEKRHQKDLAAAKELPLGKREEELRRQLDMEKKNQVGQEQNRNRLRDEIEKELENRGLEGRGGLLKGAGVALLKQIPGQAETLGMKVEELRSKLEESDPAFEQTKKRIVELTEALKEAEKQSAANAAKLREMTPVAQQAGLAVMRMLAGGGTGPIALNARHTDADAFQREMLRQLGERRGKLLQEAEAATRTAGAVTAGSSEDFSMDVQGRMAPERDKLLAEVKRMKELEEKQADALDGIRSEVREFLDHLKVG